MSKEKIVIPPSLLNQQAQPQEKLTSPYIVKSVAQGSTVRKLSGQYDSLGNRDVYNPVNSDSKTQYGINKVYNKFTTQYKQKVPLYNEPKQQYAAKTVMNSDNQGKTVLYGDTTRSSEDKQQYYASSTRATDDYGFPRRSSIDKKHYGDVRRSSESDKQHYGDIGRFSEGVSRSSDCKEQYYPQTPATTTNAMQSYYESPSKLSSDDKQHNRKQKIDDDRQIYQTNVESPSKLSSDDKQHNRKQKIDDDRQIYQTNVVVSNNDKQYYDSPLYANTQEHPYNDDVPECDAPPKMFVPGENYSIQYENPPRTPVYSTECAVTQQSYDSPQTVVKSEEDAAKIADYHNRQQQIISRIQQVSPNVREPEVYREEPKYDDESHQYTSNYHFRPQMSPSKNPKCEIDREETENLFSNETRSPYSNYERQTSQESVKEYTAVSSKVMSGPVSQQAVTVQQNTPRSRDQHDMEFNLKTTLSKLSAFSDKQEKVATSSPVLERKTSLKQTPLVVYNNVKQRPSVCINDKPLSLELLDVNEKGEQILTSKFHIPIRRQSDNLTAAHSGGHELSKSESWHQICQQNQQTSNKPSPRASPSTRSVLRSKSSHSLAVPKQFEAGMSKTEMLEKKKTMEAYFGAALTKKDNKKISSSINRVKTSQKVSTQRQISGGGTTGLCRSKTLPDIVCLDKLDDTNIDAIFEDLFNSRTTTRTTTYTQGPVTTTSQVTTTKVTSQEQMKKPMSPFAKFRQLDKQNSLNSPPSTPKSPTAGGPLFKFTDPSLNQSANTVKQRLLQWCQMKTKEYENIQLDNFSTSWSDGMAFCALIHHFLPDSFDYNTLNPKNRRHNFTLAFRVADEKAGIAPLLDVDDMVAIRKPDWKCVFTYVQSIYRRFKDDD
ncbi:Calponin homology (CH) domain [Popillia japonica]|uniref:Calponin homology (CH) domain n=1 Tax=Popillia japonica TaxID=7064 RepID=A0AAW1MYD9_POPJA